MPDLKRLDLNKLPDYDYRLIILNRGVDERMTSAGGKFPSVS